MSTKKIQILDSMIKQAENANTLGGRSASYFAVASEFNELQSLVGETPVATQISTAVETITADDLGVYVQDTEPTDAVDGDIWIDSSVESGDYTPINHVHNDATASVSGFMSAADKEKLDNLTTNNITVDDALSKSSSNPVQNKVISAALDNKADAEHTHSEYANVEHTHDEYAASEHTHDYLPTSNGTIEGRLTVNDTGNPLVAYTNPTTSEIAYTQLYQNHMAIGYTFVNSLKIDESGNIKIPTSNYGDTLPSAGSVGRIFFKKV